MEDLIKKVLYTGVGIVTSTAERVQKTVDELVERGKLSQDEGKKVVEDVMRNTESKRDEYEHRLKDVLDTALGKIQLTNNEERKRLEKRIKSLEVKLGLLTKQIRQAEKDSE